MKPIFETFQRSNTIKNKIFDYVRASVVELSETKTWPILEIILIWGHMVSPGWRYTFSKVKTIIGKTIYWAGYFTKQ